MSNAAALIELARFGLELADVRRELADVRRELEVMRAQSRAADAFNARALLRLRLDEADQPMEPEDFALMTAIVPSLLAKGAQGFTTGTALRWLDVDTVRRLETRGSASHALGNLLRRAKNRTISGARIRFAGTSGNRTRWACELVELRN